MYPARVAMCNVEGGISAATVDHDNFGFKTLLQLLDSREDSRQRLRLIDFSKFLIVFCCLGWAGTHLLMFLSEKGTPSILSSGLDTS